jgi:glycine/D-amino acid oxidase-like deaminating enzyme
LPPGTGAGTVPGVTGSLWWDTLDAPVLPRPALTASTDADVCIVGAGFSGLWSAYWLPVGDPRLRVVVVEREVAGFGASGRNGGWCSVLFPLGAAELARRRGPDAPAAMRAGLAATVAEVGAVAAAEGSTAGTNGPAPCRWRRPRPSGSGYGPGIRTAGATGRRSTGMSGSPARWAGVRPGLRRAAPRPAGPRLAEVVQRRGARLYERTPALTLRPGAVLTPGGTVRAEVVIRATEGYTPHCRGSAAPSSRSTA